MNYAIWAMLKLQGHNGGLEVLTSIRDFGQRMMLLSRLSKRLVPTKTEQKQWSKAIRALQFLNDHRINLVHGEFVRISAEGERYHVMRTVADGSSVERRLAQFSPEFLDDLAGYGVTTEHALNVLRENLAGGPAREMPSLDTLPERRPA